MKIVRAILVVALVGCTSEWNSTASDVPLQKEDKLCDTELRYCIRPPKELATRGWTDKWQGLNGGETAHTISNGLAPDNPLYFRIDVYHSAPSLHCQDIGVTSPLASDDPAQGSATVRGKVDFPYDYWVTPLVPDCRAYAPYASSYILCSEKDDKQVAICIQQVTDNPALAEQIFATFRWTP